MKKNLSLYRAIIILCSLLVTEVDSAQLSPSAKRSLFYLVPAQCQGKFKDKTPTVEELKHILSNHQAWYEDYISGKITRHEYDPRQANLCMSSLNGNDLSGVNLFDANLSGAELKDANLKGANLIGADLKYKSKPIAWND